MSSGEHCGDDDAHGHGHSHDGAEPADGAAHGHGHSHGDGAGTPLVATDAKDGIVYYTAPDGRVLHSHDGCVRALENRSLPRHSSLRSSGPRVPSTLSPRASSSPSLEQPQAPQPRPHPRRRSFRARRPRIDRDYSERSFTVGIGGPVGTGKTALMLSLCRHLRDGYDVAAITNDIFTREDGEYLVKHQALDPSRIRAVETGVAPTPPSARISAAISPRRRISRRSTRRS